MKSLETSFPERWFAIKDELSQMSDQFVTYEHYRQICAKHGEKDPDKQTSLAGFLHDLGIALNYKDDPPVALCVRAETRMGDGGNLCHFACLQKE